MRRRSGLAAGCLGAVALAMLENPIRHLMKLQPEVVEHLTSYWRLRCFLVPLTLLNMSCSGILQVQQYSCACPAAPFYLLSHFRDHDQKPVMLLPRVAGLQLGRL